MRIEIWSDVVCPWCYLGKRRLEAALERFVHRDQVEVVYRSFELDPTAPEQGTEPVIEALGRKYGGGAAAGRRMVEQVTRLAAEEGLGFDYADAPHTSTRDAHRLLQLAKAEGGPALQGELNEALFSAYFCSGRSIADPDVLREAAAGVGLDGAAVDRVLTGEQYADEVAADLAQAMNLGINGVPFFVVDGRWAVSGARPTERFVQLLHRAWEDRQEARVLADGSVCASNGCAV